MTKLIAVCQWDWSLLMVKEWRVDCSDAPLEKVVEWAPWKRLEEPPLTLLHPDLWYDGGWRWVE